MTTLRIVPLILALAALGATASLAGVGPGDPAPDFDLTDTTGHDHHLQKYLDEGKIVVLEWFNPDCPFVKKHHTDHRTMSDLYHAHAKQGVVWLAINSGAAGKQGAGLERNQKAVKEYRINYPVLLDMTGEVGKAYGATNTPHMFVIRPDGTVAYAGAIDSDRSTDTLGETNHVAEALAAVLAGKKPATAETKAYGCSVKYAD